MAARGRYIWRSRSLRGSRLNRQGTAGLRTSSRRRASSCSTMVAVQYMKIEQKLKSWQVVAVIHSRQTGSFRLELLNEKGTLLLNWRIFLSQGNVLNLAGLNRRERRIAMSGDKNFDAKAGIDDELSQDQSEKIRQRAYELYEARGREEGHDVDDWLQAKTE